MTPTPTETMLLKALENMVGQWGTEPCPICNGDCGSANPPISMCPLIAVYDARRAIATAKGEGRT